MPSFIIHSFEPQTELTPIGNSKFAKYTYVGEIFTLYWKDRKKRRKNVRPGYSLYISCDEDTSRILVTIFKAPENPYLAIQWLCGFYKKNRFRCQKDFETYCEQRRKELNWCNYREYGPITNEYAFRLCNHRSNFDKVIHLASFISHDLELTKEKVIEILNAYYEVCPNELPEELLKRVLTKRFEMDESDFCKIHFK